MAGSHYLKIKKKTKKQVKQEHISKKTEKRDKPKPGVESQAKELGIASGGSGGARRGWGGQQRFSTLLPRCRLLGDARAGGRRRPSRTQLTPARGHSLTPRRWQKEILSGFVFVFFFFCCFLSFLVFCLFFGVFCFLKEKYSEDTRNRKKKREK